MFTPVINAPRVVEVTAPDEEPVTVAELKAHLRIDQDDEDTALLALITTARRVLEGITGRSFVQTKWRAYWDQWPLRGTYLGACQSREIELPRAPLLAVEVEEEAVAVESVKYMDEAGTEQTVAAADYTVEEGISPDHFSRLRLNPDASIPALGDFPGALRVTFYAGHGDAAAVPAETKAALLQLAGHLHTNPVPVNVGNIVNEVPYTLQFLLQHLTIRSLA